MTLSRFVTAQDGVYETALAELRAGSKRSHWMWFVFPQLRGLGHSPMAERYGIASPAEASAYAGHPTLGPRLRECARALLSVEGKSATEILGHTDAMKLRSSMTLFAVAVPGESLFQEVLDRYYGGAQDELTLTMLGLRPSPRTSKPRGH